MTARARTLLLLAASLLAPACGEDGGGGAESTTPAPRRSFALGFTDFPHERSSAGVAAALDVMRRDGDLAVMHFDDGVPWEEAWTGAPYPPAYAADLERKAASQPAGHVRYLAVTPIAFSRDRLAPRRGDSGSEPRRPPWDGLGFDDPRVVQAYLSHCERMITIFDPDYFAYGIEVNLLLRLSPEQWPAFVRLASTVYEELKAAHPTLPVFLTFQVDFLHADPEVQASAIREILTWTDILAASSYPFSDESDPARLRADHFDALAALAPEKPFAVAETAWPAEDVTAPYPVPIPADEAAQRLYVERLLADSDRLSARFVCWFFTRDYDAFWESDLRFLPDAPLLRLWKDTGLYAGDGTARPALEPWRNALARQRQ